jgi:S-adenosyl methyltransferase
MVEEASGCVPFDTTVAHPARVYDFWLGGKDNFAADRVVGEKTLEVYPELAEAVRANRRFLARAVRHLVGQAGIRQFLDIGTGIPTANNTHEVAQAASPDCRVVYVDNDPIVLTHARALLTSGPSGATAYLDADLRDTGDILRRAAHTLDFTRPVAVMLLAILQFIGDEQDPLQIITDLMAATPPGSHLVISHPTGDFNPAQAKQSIADYNKQVTQPATLRTREQILTFLDGLHLLEPGLVPVSQWRPDTDLEAASPATMWAAVTLKT